MPASQHTDEDSDRSFVTQLLQMALEDYDYPLKVKGGRSNWGTTLYHF